MFLLVILQILVFNLISLHAALREHSIFDESKLTSDMTVHLIQKCFLQYDRNIAVIGDVPEMIVKKLHLSEAASTASLGDSRSRADGLYPKIFDLKSVYRQSFWIRLQRLVHTFVVAAKSQSSLRLALEAAKTSVWWNSAAFYIVTSTLENDNCKNAFIYLWTLWQMGILYSVFLCKENDESLAMYGYSPYYDGHSESWRKVEVHGGRGGHPWALLKLKQVHEVSICETIAFDKVKTLDGHPIPVGVLMIPPTLVINEKGEDWFKKHIGEDAMISHIIWKSLNGSIQPIYYTGKNPIGFAEGNNSYTGFMRDVSMGIVDHGINGIWTDLNWRVRSAYPHAASGVHFLTPSKGSIPRWVKFATIYPMPVLIGFFATLLIATISLRYIDQRPWSVAILEVIRATFSVTMSRLPKRLSSRFFWTSVLGLILVMTTGLQGSLISVLTKPTFYRNIDGVDDVLASGYPIYGYTAFKPFFDGSKLSTKFHINEKTRSCFNGVAKGHPAACVSDYMHLRSITLSNMKYHMSKESVASFYTAYLTKLDWPLFNRFDTLVQRLFNTGITGYWRKYYLNQMVRKNWAELRKSTSPNLKVLSIADLAFVFHILIIGLLSSSLVFLIELIMNRVRH